jgi:hypothetical protein
MNNATEMTNVLCKALEKVVDTKSYVKQADSIANLAGKTIKAQRLLMEYQVAREEKPQSDFLK